MYKPTVLLRLRKYESLTRPFTIHIYRKAPFPWFGDVIWIAPKNSCFHASYPFIFVERWRSWSETSWRRALQAQVHIIHNVNRSLNCALGGDKMREKFIYYLFFFFFFVNILLLYFFFFFTNCITGSTNLFFMSRCAMWLLYYVLR